MQRYARLVATAIAVLPLCGFVPYEHEGVMVLPLGGDTVEARALFSSSAAGDDAHVLIRADFPLPDRGEGYLTIRMALAPAGHATEATFDYYEKVDAATVTFDAEVSSGTIVVRDRFQSAEENSIYVEFDARFTQGINAREFVGGYALTAPSPAVLRGNGSLPPGVVAAVGVSAAGAYHRGTMDCFGDTEDTTVVGGYDYYVEEVIEDEEIIVVIDDDGSTDYDDSTSGSTDYDYDWDDSDYDYTDDESGFDCGGGDDTDTTSDSTSDDDDGFECSGDAEAAPTTFRSWRRAPIRGRSGAAAATARRVLQLSPMLLLVAFLLLLRRPPQRPCVGERPFISR